MKLATAVAALGLSVFALLGTARGLAAPRPSAPITWWIFISQTPDSTTAPPTRCRALSICIFSRPQRAP